MATGQLNLVSPCCGAPLFVSLRTEGMAYMTYEVADEIECSGERCYNSWNANTGEPASYNS